MARRKKFRKADEARTAGDFFDRAVALAEKDRFTVATGFLYLVAVILARAWLEGKVFGYASMNLYYYAWQVTFFMAVFMGAVMALSAFTGGGFRKTSNATFFVFWLIILPPLIDCFVFGNSGQMYASQYSYQTPDTILNLLFPFSGGGATTGGMAIQVFYMATLTVLYLWAKTRSAIRTVGGCLGLFLFALFMGSRPFVLTTEYVSAAGGYEQHILLFSSISLPVKSYCAWLPDAGYIPALIYQQKVLFYITANLVMFMAFFWIALRASSRRVFRAFAGSVRGARMLHGAFMVLIGVVMVRVIDLDFTRGLALDPFYILHFPYIALAVMSVCFAWQFTTMLNDIHDMKIDRVAHPERGLVRGLISKSDFKSVAAMFGILACCTSAVLGLVPFLLVVACLALGMAYSMPPLRIRKHILGTAVIGLGSLLAYLIGIFSPSHWELVYWEVENYQIVYQVMERFPRIPVPNADIIVVGLMILVALTLAPMLTQMRDYEGDMKAGMKSIYTVLGYEKGRKFVRIMVPMLFLLPLLVINSPMDLILLPVLALSSFVILLRMEDIRPVFATYLIAAVYSMLRILM